MLYRNKGTLFECLDRNEIAFPPILFPAANKRHFLPSLCRSWREARQVLDSKDDYVTN